MIARGAGPYVSLLIFAGLFATAVMASRALPVRPASAPELLVTLPIPAMVLMAGGDRYLAANLAAIRALVSDTRRMGGTDFAVQARLQSDVAWLNPFHLDNYYVAVAILPWNGELQAAQKILRRASQARNFDFQPLFYYAFHQYHFERNPAAAAISLLEAARRAPEQRHRWYLQDLAARWIERGYRADAASEVVAAMAQSAGPGPMRRNLERRAQRLKNLALLQRATDEFQSQFGRLPRRFDELVSTGLLERIPTDPLGAVYEINAQGQPVLRPIARGGGA